MRDVKNMMIIVAVIALAAVVTSPAMAYRERRAGYGSGPGNVADIGAARDLDLTAEQTEKINALRETHLKEIKPLQDQLHARSGDLRLLWLAGTPDQEKIMSLQKEVRNLRDQLTEKMASYRLAACKVLTPEQQAKVQEQGMGRGMTRGEAGLRGSHR